MNNARRDADWLRANRPAEAPASYDHINPSHYKGQRRYEPIDVIEDWGLNYHLGNALKYIARNGRKPGEDPRQGLSKAIWYLERLQDKLSEEAEQAKDANELLDQAEREYLALGEKFEIPQSVIPGPDLDDDIPFTANHEDIILFEEWTKDDPVWRDLPDH